MIHTWWSCPLIQNFWKMVQRTIPSIISENLRFNPAQYLLHHNSIPKKQYLKSLSMFMVNASRHCIPCHWRSNTIPSKKEWFRRINIEKNRRTHKHFTGENNHICINMVQLDRIQKLSGL